MKTYVNARLRGREGWWSVSCAGGRITSVEPMVSQVGEDLGGKWLVPKFIDDHIHLLPMGLDLQKLHLGACQAQADVLDAVRSRLNQIEPGQWLMAVHYDQNKFPDGQHLSRWDLDALSPSVPILLRHVNGHASVVNSAALRAAGVSEETPNPGGGEYVRGDDGRMNGVLFEDAHDFVSGQSPKPGLDQCVEAILTAGERLSEMGIGTVADMHTGWLDLPMELQAYRMAAERGCKVRMRLYLRWSSVFGPRAGQFELGADPARCRIAGVKIFADGAIGSATAAIYGEFESHAPTGAATDGQLIYSKERLHSMIRLADEAGYQVAIHSIGDYATDLVLEGYAQTSNPAKHRLEHAMLLSDSQITALRDVGCFCCTQPEFLVRFGHAYKRQLGQERASRLIRLRSILDAGIPTSLSSDNPIVKGDPRDGIRCATRRPSGFDASEDITLDEAWDGYGHAAACAMLDGDFLGKVEPGYADDLMVVDSLEVGA